MGLFSCRACNAHSSVQKKEQFTTVSKLRYHAMSCLKSKAVRLLPFARRTEEIPPSIATDVNSTILLDVLEWENYRVLFQADSKTGEICLFHTSDMLNFDSLSVLDSAAAGEACLCIGRFRDRVYNSTLDLYIQLPYPHRL